MELFALLVCVVGATHDNSVAGHALRVPGTQSLDNYSGWSDALLLTELRPGHATVTKGG